MTEPREMPIPEPPPATPHATAQALDLRRSPVSVRLMLALDADAGPECWSIATTPELAERMQVTEHSVGDALKRCERAGLVKQVYLRGGHQRAGIVLRFRRRSGQPSAETAEQFRAAILDLKAARPQVYEARHLARPLNARQHLFIGFLAADPARNAKRAAELAGYRDAKTSAARNLRDPRIAGALGIEPKRPRWQGRKLVPVPVD